MSPDGTYVRGIGKLKKNYISHFNSNQYTSQKAVENFNIKIKLEDLTKFIFKLEDLTAYSTKAWWRKSLYASVRASTLTRLPTRQAEG